MDECSFATAMKTKIKRLFYGHTFGVGMTRTIQTSFILTGLGVDLSVVPAGHPGTKPCTPQDFVYILKRVKRSIREHRHM